MKRRLLKQMEFYLLCTMVGGSGLEPLTFAMSTRRSNQLS